jgi:hypothetical protein
LRVRLISISRSTPTPAGLAERRPPRPHDPLTQFKASVGGTFRGTPYVALRGGTGGKLSYQGVFTFRDATRAVSTKTATSTGTCHR